MRYLALATDYDGTLATDGVVGAPTIEALERLRTSGRRLILVTGRELPDLLSVFSRIELFDHVVAENGAVLYCPATRDERLLAEAPPAEFAVKLAQHGVPISQGRVIVATWEPHEQTVLEVIRELGLGLSVVFNKGAVMVLPAGVTKATGLTAALEELRIGPDSVVGVGDAENDHVFLSLCGCAIAVENALPALKERADFVTANARGAGVAELIDRLLADDLRSIACREQEQATPFPLPREGR